jgi:hypothetical protein
MELKDSDFLECVIGRGDQLIKNLSQQLSTFKNTDRVTYRQKQALIKISNDLSLLTLTLRTIYDWTLDDPKLKPLNTQIKK